MEKLPSGMSAVASRSRPFTLLHCSRRSTSLAVGAAGSIPDVSSRRYPFASFDGSHCASVKWFRVLKEIYGDE